MMFIVAMSGLLGFVVGARMRLSVLVLLAAIVTACAAGAAVSMALPLWQVVLAVILAVTAFELAAFASMTLRFGKPRTAPAKATAEVRSGATAR